MSYPCQWRLLSRVIAGYAVLVITALTITTRPAQPRVLTIFGGEVSCGNFVKASAEERLLGEAWASGFVSGVDVGLNRDLLKSYDAGAVQRWLADFCKNNPLVHLNVAMHALMEYLLAQEAQSVVRSLIANPPSPHAALPTRPGPGDASASQIPSISGAEPDDRR